MEEKTLENSLKPAIPHWYDLPSFRPSLWFGIRLFLWGVFT